MSDDPRAGAGDAAPADAGAAPEPAAQAAATGADGAGVAETAGGGAHAGHSPDADAADSTAPGALQDLAALSAALEAAQAELGEANDRSLRAQAEAENTRRRAAQEVEKARKFALEKFAGELLPVVDSLEKAVDSFAGTEAGADGSQALADGVQMTLKLFLDTLGKHGLERVDPHGEPFDPQLHEAMAMVENAAMAPNSVLDVVQKGWTLNGRLLRAAMVVVTRAPAGGEAAGGNVDTTA